jgi:hypothetical protein
MATRASPTHPVAVPFATTATSRTSSVHLVHPKFGAASEVRLRRSVRWQVENRRAPAAYREPDLRVEQGHAGGVQRWVGLGQKRFEGRPVQVAANDTVAVMVDEAQALAVLRQNEISHDQP